MSRLLFIVIGSLALASCASSGQAPSSSTTTQPKVVRPEPPKAPPTASVLWQASASLKPQFSALAEAKPELLWSSKAEPSIRVASVAYSPDGKILAVGLAGGTIKLWDSRNGKLLHTLQGHDSWTNSVTFAPDGNTLASGSSDKTVKLWDAHSGKLLRTLKSHNSIVLSVAFAPNGKTLASGSYDKTIKIWDASSGELLQTLKDNKSPVLSVAFAPDGKTLVSGSWWEKTIKLWDAGSGELLRTLEGHTERINSLAFAPSGDKLVSGSSDDTVKLWDASSGELLLTLEGHGRDVQSVAFAPDGQTLASGSEDYTTKIWDASSGELKRTLGGHMGQVHSLAFAPDGKILASGSWDNTVKLWGTVSGELQLSLTHHAPDHKEKGHSGALRSVAHSPDGLTLASSSDDHTIKLWGAANGKLLRTLEGHTGGISTVAFSPDGNTLASGSNDKTIKLWDARSGDLLQTLKGHTNSVLSVAFAPDGQTLASGAMDKTIKLWDARSGELLRTLSGHTSTVFSVAFAPDGHTLASGSADDTIKLWDVESGELLRTLEGHSNYVYSVVYASDGNTLASGSRDSTIKLWDAGSGELLQTLAGGKVHSVAFAPDGNTLASDSNGKIIKLWDVRSGELLQSLEGHKDLVHSISFAPDDQSLASGSFDYTVKLWRLLPARERAWNAFVAAYDSGKADLAELSELAAIYPSFVPQHQQLQNYRSDLETLRAAADKNTAVNNYIAQRLRHYYENDAMFEKPEQRTRKTLDFTAQYMEEAMWLAYGAPQIEVGAIPNYDSEQELFHLQLQGQYPQFSQAIAVAMPPEAARALAQDSSAAQVQVSFSVSSKSIDLTEVELSFREQTYKGTPSSAGAEFAWRFPTVIPEVIVAAKTTADPELAQAVAELPAAAPDSRAWLLAIGVEDYMVAPDVPYADNSLELVSAVLAKRFGIPESNRVVLQGEQASGTFIRGNIRNTLGRLGPEDKLYFYYSGHGMPGRKGDQLYLAPRDIVVSAFEDDDFAFANLLGEIQQARVGQVMAFLDTCFSGKAKADELVFPDVAPIMVSAEQEVPEKMTVFYAASGSQFANSYEDKGHRLFSYFLAQGLVDGLSSVEDLERYVSANVAQQARAKGVIYEQIPFVDGRGGQL